MSHPSQRLCSLFFNLYSLCGSFCLDARHCKFYLTGCETFLLFCRFLELWSEAHRCLLENRGFFLPPKHRYRVFLCSVKGYQACQTMLSTYFLNVLPKCQIGVQDFSVLPPQSACWNSGCRCVGKGTPPTHGVPPRLCQRSDVHSGPPGGRLQDRTYIEASHR